MIDGLRLYDGSQQEQLVSSSVHDTRRAIPTGFAGIDSLLRRGGILPGNLVLFGGRTGTRKTTVLANMAVAMARADVPVAVVGLDEQPWQYVIKLMSAWSGRSQEWLEGRWDEDLGKQFRREWRQFAKDRVFIYGGKRPTPDHLTGVVEMAGMGGSPPAVIFIDYLKLMTRKGSFAYGDNSRIPQLVEELQLWSTENQVAVVALHQLSRNDEHGGGGNSRNNGHIPMTLAQLMYGGEDSADIVLGTYRPAKNPLGLMKMDVARQVLGDRFDEDDYYVAKGLVEKYAQTTFLQLLKNRPGTLTEERGIELLSPDDSMAMTEKEGYPDGAGDAAGSGEDNAVHHGDGRGEAVDEHSHRAAPGDAGEARGHDSAVHRSPAPGERGGGDG